MAKEYIEREAVLTHLNERLNFLREENGNYDHYTDGYEEAVDKVEDFPAADVAEVVHGEWVGTADGYADGELVYDMWNCSECGYDADGAEEKPDWNYCPNCGAKMDGERKEK